MMLFAFALACQLILHETLDLSSGRIAFASKQDGSHNIYTVTAEGKQLTRLTHQPAAERFPVWSPDAKQILYAVQPGESWAWELWVMNADGSNPRLLTRDVVGKSPRTWSVDGSYVVFETTRDGNAEIYAADVARSRIIRLTDHRAADRSPSWSADGKTIVFVSERDGRGEIYTTDLTGRATRLTTGAAAEPTSRPIWSPDGKTIAFVSSRDGNREIYNMTSDGKQLRRLTNDPAHDHVPIWSPDGRRLAFQSVRGENYDLEVMNADGSQRKRLTNHPKYDGLPAWSADGNWLAFISGREGTDALFVMDVNGGNVRQLSTHLSLDPSWASH